MDNSQSGALIVHLHVLPLARLFYTLATISNDLVHPPGGRTPHHSPPPHISGAVGCDGTAVKNRNSTNLRQLQYLIKTTCSSLINFRRIR